MDDLFDSVSSIPSICTISFLPFSLASNYLLGPWVGVIEVCFFNWIFWSRSSLSGSLWTLTEFSQPLSSCSVSVSYWIRLMSTFGLTTVSHAVWAVWSLLEFWSLSSLIFLSLFWSYSSSFLIFLSISSNLSKLDEEAALLLPRLDVFSSSCGITWPDATILSFSISFFYLILKRAALFCMSYLFFILK